MHQRVQPDRPRLCAFWLEALINGLPHTVGVDARHATCALLNFVWIYSFAAVPEYLRLPLLQNACEITGYDPAVRDPWHDAPLHALHRRRCGDASIALLAEQRHTLGLTFFWALEGDGTFEAWREITTQLDGQLPAAQSQLRTAIRGLPDSMVEVIRYDKHLAVTRGGEAVE